MSSNKPLPDFIDVANIRNLFWNNNSDLYPTCVPTNYHRINKTRPVFYSPYVGTCVLTGEFNHCIYNGTYYFLTKLEVLDLQTKRYKYQLDYDVMINFMNVGVEVNGTLIKSNREDILEACLQTTKPILADPIRKTTYSYNKSTSWQDRLVLKLFDRKQHSQAIKAVGITRESYNVFINNVENNAIAKGTRNKEWLATKREFNIYSHTDPLIVLESLNYDFIKDQWRDTLLLRLKAWLLSEKLTGFKNLVIVKQSTPTDHFNVGGYAVGVRDKTIGSNIVSEVSLSEIDLSGLKYIQPIDNRTKRIKQPNKTPTYNILPHTDDIKGIRGWSSTYTILRRPYLPIANDKSSEGAIPYIKGTTDYTQLGVWRGIDAPQKITTNSGSTGFLWYIDKNNLALLGGRLARLKKSSHAWLHMSVYDDAYSKWAFFDTTYKNLAPLGFLIFQLKKPLVEWDGLTLKVDSIDKLWYRSGLSINKTNTNYLNPKGDPWWANIDPSMESLWGDRLFARLHLDLDQFNWLSIAPSYTGLRYKYYYENYWGYQKFFTHAGNREKWYPSRLNRMNIKWKGKEVDNPYAHADPNLALPQWLKDRETKLDDVSIYTDFIPTNTIKKGDIVFTTYEYKPQSLVGSWVRWHMPYNITNDEWNRWVIENANTHQTNMLKLAKVYQEKNDEMRESNTLNDVLSGLGVAASVIAAPFTGGASLAVGAASLAGMHLLAAEGKITLDKEELAYMVNIEPHSDPNASVITPLLEGIVFYLYRGEYRLGVLDTEDIPLQVSNNADNLVDLVNGTKTSSENLVVIRPISDKLDFNNDNPISDNDKQNIIKYGYGMYPDDQIFISSRDREKVHYYGVEDIKTGTNTFDLVGTDWYLVTHNNQLNLVPKTDSVFNTIDDEGRIIHINDDVSIEAKVNQKAYLNYHGQVFPLNTKFTFNNDEFRYKSKPLKLEQKYADPDVEYKWLNVNIENDNIDVLVTLPRKETRAAEKVDSSQVLMMKERLLQLTTNYEQDKYANELMMSDKRLSMARQREDLDTQWWSSAVGIGGKVATLAASSGVGIASGGTGAVAGAAGLGALGALGSMKSDIEFLIKYPTLMKRVSEDERNLLLANSQALYQRKQNYEHDFRYQTLKLNKIAGSYQKTGVSNREAQEKYVKERKVSDVFVEVLLPSQPQLDMVNTIFNAFGCECVSDRFELIPLSIRSDMFPGIYKFSRIEDGIRSDITDSTLREILRQILENGVKFQECNFEIDALEVEDIRPITPITISPHPEIDPTKIIEWPKELWDVYRQQKSDEEVITNIKKAPHYGLTDAEWDKYKDQIRTGSDKDLLEDISNIISNRDGGTTVIIGTLPTETDNIEDIRDQLQTALAEKADVEAQRNNLQTKKAELEAKNTELKSKIDDLENKKIDLEAAKADLEAKNTDLQTKNTDLQDKKTELENKNRELEDMKSELEDDKQQLESAKATLEAKKTELEARLRQCEEDKGLRPENCDAEVAAARDAIQKQLDETTAMLKKNRAALRAKNEALAKANTEKDKIQQELNTVKSDLATAQGSVNRITAEKGDIERQLNECRATIETYTQDIETLNEQKTDLTEQLRQCKIDLENIRQSKDTCDRVNSDEIKKLRAKIKELEGDIVLKQVEIDAAKKGLDATVIRAETLSKEYKNLEEKLKEQTNVSNLYKQEADSFKRQKENLETQKADIERQLREALDAKAKVQKELDDLKKTVKSPTQLQDECNLMKEVLNDPFEIDVKQREGGLSRFIDLIVMIADGIKWMRRAGIDQRLMNNQKMRPIIQRLDEFENIEIVDKIEDVTRDPHWDKFLKVINQTNLNTHKDADVQRIYDRMRQISALQIPYIIHGVKASLDELNYITFKTKEELKDQIKTNEDLEYFFKHIYPGNAIKVYKEIFGSPEAAIVRKRFTFETQCTPDQGESVITTLDKFNKTAKETVEGIPAVQPGTAPIPPGLPTFMGIPLTREKRFFIQPFNWFRDAKNPKGVAAFKVGKDANGNPLSGVEAYNYPYTIKDRSDESQQNRNAIWVQYFTQWGSSNSNYYMIKETGDVARVRDAALHLWRNKSKCLIADSAIQEFSNPNVHFSISITMRGFQQHGTYQKNELPIGGKGALLKGLGNYTKDFMILWMILNSCRYTAKKWRTSGVESGGYKVTEVTGQWMSEWPTTTFEWGMAAHQTSTNMEVSFIVPTEYVDDLKTQLDTRIGTGNMTNRHGAIYRLLSWMYAVVSQPDQAEDLIRMMFDPSTPFGKFLDFKVRS